METFERILTSIEDAMFSIIETQNESLEPTFEDLEGNDND